MGAATYAVVCELGLDGFDRPAEGRAALRRVHAALRRVAREDRRVSSTSVRRRSRTAELVVVVDARTAHRALEVATWHLRSAFAAAGQAPVAWASVRPEVQPVEHAVGRGRARRGSVARPGAVPSRPSFPSWADVAADSLRRARPVRPLPPLAVAIPGAGATAVIDLR